jgi:hypothetical protein
MFLFKLLIKSMSPPNYKKKMLISSKVSKNTKMTLVFFNKIKGKIYISPPNYHNFSEWHPELPTLAL